MPTSSTFREGGISNSAFSPPSLPPSVPTQFALTRWSIVLTAGNAHTQSSARRAMGELIQTYWPPLYAYLRRKRFSVSESEDLVQDFFTHLIEKEAWASADPARGKFRSFLLASLKNFQVNLWHKDRAQKRGGGRKIFSLNSHEAEKSYAAEPADDRTPEKIFDRRWAFTLLQQVLTRLHQEYAQRQQETLFEALKHVLTGTSGKEPGDTIHYHQIAQTLNATEGAVKTAAHRLRRRYRELLREEISQTLSDPTTIDEEIQYLLASL